MAIERMEPRMGRRAFTTLAILTAAGCGKSGASGGSDADTPAGGDAGVDSGVRDPDGGDSDPAGAEVGPITLHPRTTGLAPYMAAIYPPEGAVPDGRALVSEDDPSLDGAILSRWPDGSASVVVVAGEGELTAGATKTLSLRAGGAPATPLDAVHVASIVDEVTIDCGALGSASITQLESPERVWWASRAVVCCRYRSPVGADATLEAIVDVHAFASGRAFVEVVLENGRIDPSEESPARPETKSYEATVTVNGSPVATVASPAADQAYVSGRGGGTYAGGHEAFRAFYVATWIGGDPGAEVTHDIGALQAHPLAFRCWKDASTDFEDEYRDDAYAPWSAGRLNVPGMPGTGDIEGIGPFTQWDTRYLQTGSKYVSRAVVASALGALSCNVSVRDRTSGLVPTHAQAAGHDRDQGTWPETTTEPAWEMAHHPAVGLLAFACRPSPVLIEIAQKVAIWNASSFGDGVFGFWAQVRGKAWGIRSLAHAIFLTPDEHPWKAPAKASLRANLDLLNDFRASPNNLLGLVWHASPTSCADFEQANPGMQQPLWMHHFLVTSLHAADRAKLLEGEDQALMTEIADWAAMQPVRYVNEAANGEWRLHNYLTTVGREAITPATGDNLGSGVIAATTFDSAPTYPENLGWYYLDDPPPSAGTFLFIETNPGENPDFRYWSSASESRSAGVSYAAVFWAALVVATEREIEGAEAAWEKVTTEIVNLDEWSASFAEEPRYNRYPRNR